MLALDENTRNVKASVTEEGRERFIKFAPENFSSFFGLKLETDKVWAKILGQSYKGFSAGNLSNGGASFELNYSAKNGTAFGHI
jgi:hypothetical protein